MSDPEEQLDYGDSDHSQDRISFSAGSAGLPSGASGSQEAAAKDQPGEEVSGILHVVPATGPHLHRHILNANFCLCCPAQHHQPCLVRALS